MKCIILTRPDGSVRVLHPAYNDLITGQRPGENEDAYLSRVIARNQEAGQIHVAAVFKIVEAATLPTRDYREAWSFDGTTVKHDMTVARQIKLDAEIRPERNKRLAALDIDWSRAMAQGNTTLAGQIETKRQTLRDIPTTVTPSLDAITDPTALKTFTPSWPP